MRSHNSDASLPGSAVDLQQRIEKIYDHLYANAGTRTPAGISTEVGKILHVATYVEQSQGREVAFPVAGPAVKALTAGEKEAASDVALEVRNKFAEMNRSWRLYDESSRVELSDFDIAYTCAHLAGVKVSDSSRDVFGDALEIFRSQWAKRTGGQFFTDSRVTSLAIALLDYDPRRGDDLVDICAGTGGFLLAGLNHIRRLLEREGVADEAFLVSLASRTIRGQEVDREVCDIANATLASRLGSIHDHLVQCGDSLQPWPDGGPDARMIRPASHLCAATNPPFGTKTTVKDPAVLRQFELARVQPASWSRGFWPEHKTTARPLDILLLEQNVRLLKPGDGRLAIVLPYQILSGPQTLYVRDWVLRHMQPTAVIDLPLNTFQPHTGTKTALFVGRRRTVPLAMPHEAARELVFMAMPRWIGHDRRGNAVFRRTPDGKITDEVLSDIEDVAEAFEKFKAGEDPSRHHAYSFAVSLETILKDPLLRMNALFHAPSPAAARGGAQTKGDNWRVVRLGDVVERVFVPARFRRNYVDQFEGAIPFLGGTNITQLHARIDRWLHPSDPRLEQLRVRSGWILVTRSGSTGIVSSVPLAWDGFAMSEHVIRIVPDPAKLDPDYLQACLRSSGVQEQLKRGVFGSVIDEITPDAVRQLKVPVHDDMDIVKRIADSVRRSEEGRLAAIEQMAAALERLEGTA